MMLALKLYVRDVGAIHHIYDAHPMLARVNNMVLAHYWCTIIALDLYRKYSYIHFMKLHESQNALLQAIRQNPNASLKQLRDASGIKTLSVVEYHLKKMIENGLIRKSPRWEIIQINQ